MARRYSVRWRIRLARKLAHVWFAMLRFASLATAPRSFQMSATTEMCSQPERSL